MNLKKLTLTRAKKLKPGDMLYHVTNCNADGTPQRWRVNGQVKRWKRDINRIEIPIKNGLYNYDKITNETLNLVKEEK